MPRKPKQQDGGTVHADERPKTNRESLQAFVDRVENVQADIDRIMKAAKDECIPLREDLANITKEAADSGYSKKEFKTVIRSRRLEQKLEHVADSLDTEQATYEDMLAMLGAFGETELGKAALAGTEGAPAAA